MTKDLLQQQVDRGQEASLFLQYLEGNKYFYSVLTEIENELNNQILDLPPSQKEEFVMLQSKRRALYEPMGRVNNDKVMGELAQQQLDGNNPNKGIL